MTVAEVLQRRYGGAREAIRDLAGLVNRERKEIGLVVLPRADHPLVQVAREIIPELEVKLVTPDMAEADRRELGLALQEQRVHLLFVTPERLEQPKFVTYVGAQPLAYVALLPGERTDVETLPDIQGAFPGVPVVVIRPAVAPASPESSAPAIAPTVQENPARESVPSKVIAAAPAARPAPTAPTLRINPAFEPAFALLDREAPLDEVATLHPDGAPWAWAALEHWLRIRRRAHPFPWVTKPEYLLVSVAAGKAESTNPRLLASVLDGQVAPERVRVIAAALDNRNG